MFYSKETSRLSLCFMVVGLGVGLISPLSVFLVTERLGLSAQDLQWITIPYGAGEILGGIVTFMLASRIAPGRLLMMGLIVNGAGILLLGLSTILWLTMLSQFLIAPPQPAIFIGNHTLVMQRNGTSLHRSGYRLAHAAHDRSHADHNGMLRSIEAGHVTNLRIRFGWRMFFVGFLMIIPPP